MPHPQTEKILRPGPRWSLNLNQEEVEGVRFLGPRTERWKINYIQLAKQSCSEANQPHLSPSPLSRKQKFSIENVKNWHLLGGGGRSNTQGTSALSQWRTSWSFYKAWRDCFRSHQKITLFTPAKEIPRRHKHPQNLSKYIVLSTKQFLSDHS